VREEDALVFLPFGTGISSLSRTERTRPLQGQSPYVVNVGVDYSSPRRGTMVSVLYNRSGRRIDTVGDSQIPDVYEAARGQLDLVVEQPLSRNLSLKLTGKRLLGSEVEFTQKDLVVGHYDVGREASFSVSWKPGG
jgi:hypothetical protein